MDQLQALRTLLSVVDHCSFVAAARAVRPFRGSKPEPQKFPSSQLRPRHERVQVDHLAAALEGVVPVQQDVPPSRR